MIDALQNPVFLEAAQKRLNQTVDEDEIKSRIESLEKARAQLIGAKNKLSPQMDSLDVSDKHYDAKYEDMQQGFDKFFDEIAEVYDNI